MCKDNWARTLGKSLVYCRPRHNTPPEKSSENRMRFLEAEKYFIY